MKRKKQSEDSTNGHNDEPTSKRARSGKLWNLGAEAVLVNEDETTFPTRGNDQLDNNTEEEEQEATPFQESSYDKDEVDEDESDKVEQATERSAESEADGVPANERQRERINGGLTNSAKKTDANGTTPVKGPRGKKLFSTPSKTRHTTDETPKLERHVNRSARRKSTRNLIERIVLGNTSDNEEGEEDIEGHIYGSGDDEEEEDEDAAQEEREANDEIPVDAPETPSKKRGRRKGSKNKQPSPPPTDLPAHELYFSQNRGGRSKTSNNTLSSLQLLDHEEYFTLLRTFVDPHTNDVEWLQELHAGSFNQWQFELSQNFNICLFGWGSKRSLLMSFAEHIYNSQMDHSQNKIVVVNGYVLTLTIRDVLNTIAAALTNPAPRLGSQPTDMLENLLSVLGEDTSRHITVIIHAIDRAPLRRPATQIILSRLSCHPQIQLVASADHPWFPLLWDSSLRSMYNFLFHDCTTFQPYSSEIDVVEEVHELLGRSGRRVGGKEGVSFVLKSLPENAKNLFRVLIGEQLAAMDDSSGAVYGKDDDDDDDEDDEAQTGSRRHQEGVEYRVLYQKAVEEFICSNEMNFRTLLKEFHDHQMIQSRKDALGTEMLSVPFRKEELEMILEDIVS
ncbi:Origin recognition complex subunit 2 [Hyphodiscus hymeniophilus]|uniref:Origin recognition complex subunit 2 n=1 Tax=Hyphodiscus hymeniophilus TaxID=353542 RepID=A0A9P7AWS1_9HELO|nr:Origin recognition complex subunit 2 [Hyphodiscus hymeniophilus]